MEKLQFMKKMDELSDEELVALISKGNHAAFEIIVKRYQTRILKFVIRFLNDKSIAEDITQEVFIRLFESASSYKSQAKFRTWFFKIVTNSCLMYKRKLAPEIKLSLEAMPSKQRTPDSQLESIETRVAIEKAIKNLSPQQRLALILNCFEDLSHKEIAEIMEISVGTVEQHIHRAYLNLKDTLSKFVIK